MNAKTDPGASPLDTVKLVLAAAVIFAGVAGYYVFDDESVLLRAIGVVAAVAVAAFIAFQSTQGRTFWRFVQSSRVELRKVVWPNRQETTTTTGMVMLFALILGVFFWLLDMLLLYITRLATGYGG